MPDAQDSSLFDEVGPAISRLRRRAPTGEGGLTRNLVLNIVGDRDGETTVGTLATEMGVSQPVASRAAASAIEAGMLRRVASQADGRRTVLELTGKGLAERRRFASAQRRVFEEITARWTDEERDQFARLLLRYSEDSAAWGARDTSNS